MFCDYLFIMTNNSFIIIEMENKTITFLTSRDQSLVFENQINEIKNNVSPFKEILEKSDYTDYSVVFDDNKESAIKFSEMFHLRVNVKNVGGFDFLFKQDGFEKEMIIEKISALKEMLVDNLEQAKAKAKALFDVFGENRPLFLLYSPKGEYVLAKEDLSLDTFKFFIKREEKPAPIKPIKPVKPIRPIKKEEKNTESATKRKALNKELFKEIWEYVCYFFMPLKENVVHYAFILISIFLIGFSSSVGIYYCYAGNNVFYFLFICSLVGGVLNYFVYYDYFKNHKVLSNDSILTIIDILLSIGIAIGGFYVFFVLQKEIPEAITNEKTILLIMVAVIIGINAISCPIAYFLRKRKESTTK